MAVTLIEFHGDEKKYVDALLKAQQRTKELEDELAKVGQAGKKAGDEVGAGFEKAESETSRVLRKMQAQLRALGPEGKAAADAIKTELVTGGKTSEQAMDSLLAKVREINPAAAEAAMKARQNLTEAAEDSESAFDSFGDSAIGTVSALAASFLGVQSLLSQINDELERKARLLKAAEEAQLGAASSQAGAALNFAALDPAVRRNLLEVAPSSIASKLGFDNVNVIQDALSQVVATGQSDEATIVGAVEAAVMSMRHTPSDIPALAAAIANVATKSGLQTDEAASTLLTAQATFLSANFADLAKALPQVIGAVKSTSPIGQGTTLQDATRQAGALLSAAAGAATDDTGLSSTTFVTTLAVKLDEFFEGMDRQRIEARSKIELIERKIAKGKDTEKDLDDKSNLEAFLASSEGLIDPKDAFARLSELTKNEALRQKFLDETSVETRFKIPLQQLVTEGSEVRASLASAFDTIKADPQTLDAVASSVASATPQLRTATAGQAFDAALNLRMVSDRDAATQSQIMDRWMKVNDQLRTGGVSEWLENQVMNWGRKFGAGDLLRGDTAAEKVTDFVLDLATRDFFDRQQAGGMFGKPQEGLADRSKFRQEQIAAALLLLDSLEGDVAPESGLAASRLVREAASQPALQNQTELLSSLERLLQQIADNTAAGDLPATPALSPPP